MNWKTGEEDGTGWGGLADNHEREFNREEIEEQMPRIVYFALQLCACVSELIDEAYTRPNVNLTYRVVNAAEVANNNLRKELSNVKAS